MAVAEPHKELRFTRAAQAVPFWIAAASLAMAAITLIAVGFYRHEDPSIPHPLWALLPLALSAGCIRVALHCTRHAYLILSPLGVEVFPLLKPAKGMQMIPWTQIEGLDLDPHRITLHFDQAQSQGIHLSLAPIEKSRRTLLIKALDGRVASPS